MKKLVTLILLLVTVNAAAEQIHTNCQDFSFAYNSLNVAEIDGNLVFSLRGATILPLRNGDWTPQIISKIVIEKDKCHFSDDGLLISCDRQDEVTIRRMHTKVVLKDFALSISFVERAVGLFKQAFVLKTEYQSPQDEDFIRNEIHFPGSREAGCSSI